MNDRKKKEEESNREDREHQNPEDKAPFFGVKYIKDKKTGEWKIVNPAGSTVYNYLNRDEFPDD